MATLVRDDGSVHARIVLVGEAPGTQETAQGRPFVGASGMRLAEWWRGVGLQRTDFYVTNVYPYQPPGNDLAKVPAREIAEWTDRLHARLAELTDPWVIVPTGNTALQALTGKRNILKHRGSVYGYQDRKGRTIKVIPTIHPAATFRTPGWERRCRHDWARIAEDAAFRDLRLPDREHTVRPTMADLETYISDTAQHAEALAIDIETPGGQIVCVGFSADPSWSLTVPTTLDYWGTRERLAQAWGHVKTLCALPVDKVLQNGHFDTFWLASVGVTVRQWTYDCLAMHHALDATDAHDLAYMASVDTRQPYWKDEAKDPNEAAKYASNREALYVYNGIDCCVQRELGDVYGGRLHERGMRSFYERHYQALFLPLLRVMRGGVRLDASASRRRHARLTAQCLVLQNRLAAIAGRPLHGTQRPKSADGRLPDLSHTKIAKFLYEDLNIPKQVKRGTGRVTTDEVTVRRMMLKYPAKLSEVGALILEHRRKKKVSEFLDEGKVDDDGRMRCTYKFTTESGRLASSKNPIGTGRNLQNIDRDVRDVFLPDAGHIFLEADLSQAESRVVYALTNDPDLVDIARRPAATYDVHKDNATIIFGCASEAVTAEQRYLAKRGVHASHYGLHGTRLSEELLKDGVIETPERCQEMIEAYLGKRSAIREWQQETRMTVLRDRALVNSWGRVWSVEYERPDDDLWRRAYAFVPQSEIADLMNQWGLVPIDRWLRERRMASRVALHVHDALVFSCPPSEVYAVMSAFRGFLERGRTYNGNEVTIPVDFSIGRVWKKEKEWKEWPTEGEVSGEVGRLVSLGLK